MSEVGEIGQLSYQVWLLQLMQTLNNLSDAPDDARCGVMAVLFVGRSSMRIFEQHTASAMLDFSDLCDFFFLTAG